MYTLIPLNPVAWFLSPEAAHFTPEVPSPCEKAGAGEINDHYRTQRDKHINVNGLEL
jgi:hypothetical protein